MLFFRVRVVKECWHVHVVWITLVMSDYNEAVAKHVGEIAIIWNAAIVSDLSHSFDDTINMRVAPRLLTSIEIYDRVFDVTKVLSKAITRREKVSAQGVQWKKQSILSGLHIGRTCYLVISWM